MIKRSHLLIALAGLAQFAPAAVDTAAAQTRGDAGWYFEVAPYVWFSNIDGVNTLGDVSLQVGDSVLERRFVGTAAVGKGRWRGIANFTTASLSSRTELEGASVPPGTQVTYDFSQTTAELFATAQVGTFLTTNAFQLLGGVRYVRQEQKLVDGPQPGSITEEWIEPVFGANYFAAMGGRFWAVVAGDIGGFNIGSKFTWRVGAQLGFTIAKPVDVTMAYDYMAAQYKNDDTGYSWDDGVTQGWLFGVIIKG
jgi:hypothetical protein